MTKSSSRSYYSRFNNKMKGNYRRTTSLNMSITFNNKIPEKNSSQSILYTIGTAENSNKTSQTTNKTNSLSFLKHGEYVKQKPNKLVRADLFKDQKKTGFNSSSSVTIANGVNFKSQIVNKKCTYFNKYGRCKVGNLCPYKHNPNHVEICKKWLKGIECSGKKCSRQHTLSAHVTPHCSHFAKGMCLKGSECRYTHVKVSKRADHCKEFMVGGFCDAGKNCRKKHEWGRM